MEIWQLQEAKSKFSYVVDEAIKHGPQMVSRRGVESVVILSKEDFDALTLKQGSLLDDLLAMPKIKLNLDRPKDKIREVEF